MPRKLRTLLFSTLYPSAARPVHGIFVETRLRELLKTGEVETRVVAPVPWFPSTHPRFGARAQIARTPSRETRHGIDVMHPRYPLLPKLGMTLAPFLMAMAAVPAIRRLIDEGFSFDLIDAHYYYPDGVAAAMLARHFGRPLVVTARGSDINLISDFQIPRRLMQWAGKHASASIGVSEALVEKMAALQVCSQRLHKVRNGVDLERFQPQNTVQARQRLGLTSKQVLLSVGNLIPLKGHDVCIDALAVLRERELDANLVVIGAGPELHRLQEHALSRGVASHVRFVGQVPNSELAAWYSASDVLLLASTREGWPNVLLEAMACGTPVVASHVGGVPEVLLGAAPSQLVKTRDGRSFAEAVVSVLQTNPIRASIRKYAESFGWEPTSQRQLDIFRSILVSEAAHA